MYECIVINKKILQMFTQNKMTGQYTTNVPTIVPDEDDLPGWVPKNYIEKGIVLSVSPKIPLDCPWPYLLYAVIN